MKFFKYTALIMAAFSMVACDDTTDMIGSSITNNVDKLTVTDATYNVITNSLAAGSVLSKTNNGIIGKVLSLIHISEPTRLGMLSRMPSSA